MQLLLLLTHSHPLNHVYSLIILIILILIAHINNNDNNNKLKGARLGGEGGGGLQSPHDFDKFLIAHIGPFLIPEHRNFIK